MAITLEKEMYDECKKKGLSLTKLLHQLEPGDEELDAFERQMKKQDLVVSGEQVSLVEDFYKTTESSILFPEFIWRQILIGMEQGRNECQLEDVIATRTEITSGAFKSISASTDSGEAGAYRVGEGGEFPTTLITTTEKAVVLVKIGHRLKASYEFLRRMSLDLAAVHFRLIGRRLRRSMVAWAIDTIINGDGNSNPAPSDALSGMSYSNLIDFDLNMEDFEASTWICNKTTIGLILKLTEFKDPQAGFNYQATGKLISPLGITLRKQTTVAANTLIAVDKTSALQMLVEAGSQYNEVDKIIGKQLQETVISQDVGFAKIYTEAARVLDFS